MLKSQTREKEVRGDCLPGGQKGSVEGQSEGELE